MKKTLLKFIKDVFETGLLSLGIFLFIYIFLVQPHRVKGESMMPNFANNELLLSEKLTYRIYQPSRGDVIVFRAPLTKNVDFIKRIVGLPGENVEINNDHIFINGKKLLEPYETQSTQGDISLKLGRSEYFVLGDNRGFSSDSRTFGSIGKNSIKGRAWIVYWPIFKVGEAGGARTVSGVDYGISNSFDDR